MGIGEFPQQAENRFRVTKALLAEEWYLCEVTINSNTVNTDMYKTIRRKSMIFLIARKKQEYRHGTFAE